MADDLEHPLGLDPEKHNPRLAARFLPFIAGTLGIIIAFALVWIAIVDDPLGGEPFAITAITPSSIAETLPAGPTSEKQKRVAQEPQPGIQTVTIIDGISGARKQVTVSTNEPDPAPTGATPIDAKFIEHSRHGAIPHVATDGTRPLDLYARAGANITNSKGPRIAIVVGGLGIGVGVTAEAITKLTPEVTLAFVPYGADLPRLIGRARGAGHEVLLQVPMEPADYPNNDPGPQTLLSTLTPEQNLDRLYWFLSRTQGYIGITNYMGARFSASEAALSPVLQDLGNRGLAYLDDGASPQSLASEIAAKTKTPFIKADLVLDEKPGWAEIDIALTRLEALAKTRGFAVGMATAQPVSIERIARWMKAAEARGIRIVPLSAILLKPKQT
jgi:polysaccharide deacetylase 2 family uncharacterized protein YibQ